MRTRLTVRRCDAILRHISHMGDMAIPMRDLTLEHVLNNAQPHDHPSNPCGRWRELPEFSEDRMKREIDAPALEALVQLARANLISYAALSPEAPAREEAGLDVLRDWKDPVSPSVKGPVAWRWRRPGGVWNYQEDRQVIPGTVCEPLYDHALTPRHEAPAEGAGEDGLSDLVAAAERAKETLNAIAGERRKFGPIATKAQSAAWQIHYALNALRARSSAPEGREGEAVAWMRLTAGRITHLTHCKMPGYVPLFTHPAAPSADKLAARIAQRVTQSTKES